MNLLKPEKGVVEKTVKEFENEWGYSDRILYKICVDDIKHKNMSQIGHEEIKNIIKTFLINWGMMGRVLNSKKDNIKNLWQDCLKKLLKNFPS